jgi:hypothetical protein
MKTTATALTVGLITLAVFFSLASVEAQNASGREVRELGWFNAVDVHISGGGELSGG